VVKHNNHITHLPPATALFALPTAMFATAFATAVFATAFATALFALPTSAAQQRDESIVTF